MKWFELLQMLKQVGVINSGFNRFKPELRIIDGKSLVIKVDCTENLINQPDIASHFSPRCVRQVSLRVMLLPLAEPISNTNSNTNNTVASAYQLSSINCCSSC